TLHLVKKRSHDTRARAAERVTDGDRAAVDVGDLGTEMRQLHHRKRLDGERLIQLDQVNVVDTQPGTFQDFLGSRDRAITHSPWVDTRCGAANPACDWGKVELRGLLSTHQ